MTFWQLILHLFNFVLPALTMALFMPLAGRWVIGSRGPGLGRRVTVHVVSGVLVLAAGLWLQGQDGKMSTYMALVLVTASAEWWMQRGWADK